MLKFGDLRKYDEKEAEILIRGLENKTYSSITRMQNKPLEHTGKILHLDGDTHLSNQKKYSNINTSKQVIFNHNKNNVSKIKIHYFFKIRRN